MKRARIGVRRGRWLNRYMRSFAWVCLVGLMGLFIGVLPRNTQAWNSSGLVDLYNPYMGLNDYSKTHEWIVHEAIDYLKKHNYLPKGTWFDDHEFEELLQWGVAYADHTGKKISAGFGYSIDWDIDGFRHFYHPASIWVTLLEGDWGDTDFAHVGELTAPVYAKQLYKRAVEFWPNGAPPLDLDSLTKAYRLGYTWDAPDEYLYVGWARGTDPRFITSGSRLDPPEWPPWVAGNQEDKETAAIFLGWALHMIQDMSVYHHTKNLHGVPHQDYEAFVEGLVKDNMSEFSNKLPIPRGGQPFCTTYISCDESSSMACIAEKVTHCYDLFPHYAFFNLDTFNIEKLANTVAYYVFKEAKAPHAYYTADVATNSAFLVHRFNFKNNAYVKHCLDAAIKATATVIYKFISDVSQVELPEDKFEPNDTYFEKWPLNPGNYYNLAISNKLDDDYYLIKMPYQGDLEISIEYDNRYAEIGMQLYGPYQPHWPTATPTGKIFKLKGIASGEYVLHLQPGILWEAPANGDVTTTYYNLSITLGGKRLDPDWLEDNDTAVTADERLCSSTAVSMGGLTIDAAGDDDYYLVEAPIGFQVDVSIGFDPSEGELHLFFNDEEVGEEQEVIHKSFNLPPDSLLDGVQTAENELPIFFDNGEVTEEGQAELNLAIDYPEVQRPSINERMLQELKPSLSPSPTASELSRKTLTISRCSSGRDIIRITGQANYYSISVSKKAALDVCGIRWRSRSDIAPSLVSKIPFDSRDVSLASEYEGDRNGFALNRDGVTLSPSGPNEGDRASTTRDYQPTLRDYTGVRR